MKRFLSLLVFLLPSLVYGQGPSSAQIEAAKGIVKLYTTAGLPATCAPGQRVWDTTANATKVCANDGVTWSSISFTGGTITSPLLLPNGTVLAPALAFASETNSGFYRHGPTDLRISVASSALAAFANDSVYADHFVLDINTGDVWLYRDAANTLALRNSTNAQTFNWYYSYTDGSNYHRGALKTSASGIEIAAETAGSGADNLDVTLTPAGTGAVNIPATYGYPALKLLNGSNVRVYGGLETAVDRGYLAVIDASAATTEMHVGSFQGSKTKTLTDAAAAAAFVRIAVPQTVGSNYAGGDVVWTAFAADATPHTQSLSGRLTFTAINNAGTEVCAVDPTAAVTAPNANSSGTLQCTFSCASNAADTIDLMATCDTSLGTPTALSLLYRLDMPQPNTVTPQ